MKTYQDLLEIGESEQARIEFIQSAINNHKDSSLYKDAILAKEYMAHKNRTIVRFQKLLYTVSGKAIPDNYSANYKMASNFFKRFVTQQNLFLLGNGITWENKAVKDKLGYDFEHQLIEAGKHALEAGVSFGFFNLDHMEVFEVTEFVPLYDEENGALMAGIRFWQIDSSKPMRATLYEIDGYTDYIWKEGKASVLKEKRNYILNIRTSDIEGTEIYDGENYPTFPIVPLFGNPEHQSELTGIQEQIDCYDLIKSGFANTIDEASFIYWTINNAGGMDDIDLAKFVERMKTVHAGLIEDSGATAEAHNIEAPYNGRQVLLDRLRQDLYEDFMALDTKNIASGATTATQIKAAYEPLNNKCDEYEDLIRDFIRGILDVAGIEDEPTFTRSMLINEQEEVQTVLTAASYLGDEYVTRKVLTIMGDGDLADDILAKQEADEIGRFRELANQFDAENQNQNQEQEQGIEEEVS